MSASSVKDFVYKFAQDLKSLSLEVHPSFGWLSLLAFKDTDGSALEVSATNPIPVGGSITPKMTDSGFLSATTSGGASYVAFSSQACSQLTIQNNTGYELLVQKGGSGVAFPIPDGQPYPFTGLTNADQLAVKRTDEGAAITVKAEWVS